jgi:hypothetical protein
VSADREQGAWVDGGCVHLDDVNGFSFTIPTRFLPEIARRANDADSGRALYGFNWFNRDVLNGAVDLLPKCTYSDQFTSCDRPHAVDADGHALTDLRDRPVCDSHAPRDDKDD